MHSLEKLQKPDVLAVPIATLLREAIFDRRLHPGDRIVERQLAEQWNVSRAPLREAIKQLSTEGLLVISPHRGASVREVSKKELTELFLVREMIEVAAVRIAAEWATDSDLARLQTLVDGMKIAAERRDLPTFSTLGLAFHDELVRLSKNDTLVEIYDGVKLRFRRYQFLLVALPDVPRSSAAEHEEILAALHAKDGDRASACVAGHLAHLITAFADRLVDHRPSTGRTMKIGQI
jgi:DNA-binding GntR family transcriptional regulator